MDWCSFDTHESITVEARHEVCGGGRRSDRNERVMEDIHNVFAEVVRLVLALGSLNGLTRVDALEDAQLTEESEGGGEIGNRDYIGIVVRNKGGSLEVAPKLGKRELELLQGLVASHVHGSSPFKSLNM